MLFRFRTIRWKLIVSSLLAIGIPLMVFAYAMAALLWNFYRGNLEKELQSKAHLIAEACSPVLSPHTPDDPRTLRGMVQQWQTHSDVRVTITNADGIIEAASTPGDVGNPVDSRRRPGLREALSGLENSTIWKNPQFGNQDTMYVNVPVREENRIIGAVRVAYTLTQIQERIGKIRTLLFTSVAVYAALIVALTFWLANSIAAPLEALTGDAQRLARGELSHRIHLKGTEEVNQLGQTLNQMSERLEQLEGLRRQYVSDVSHELRTPLASIRGMAETLLEHGETDPELRGRYLPRIIAQTDRLARLASQLLDLAQIESGNLVNFFAPTSMAAVIEEATHTCSERANERGVQLVVTVADDLPQIIADRDRLVQVFLNLVDNAVRYTPAGGRVQVSAQAAGSKITVAVEDTGSGIPAEHLPHLFERFYRVDRARTLRSGGTGLGLSIVEQIVKAHGGTIRVTSEEGKGTRFDLTLPPVPPAAERPVRG